MMKDHSINFPKKFNFDILVKFHLIICASVRRQQTIADMNITFGIENVHEVFRIHGKSQM